MKKPYPEYGKEFANATIKKKKHEISFQRNKGQKGEKAEYKGLAEWYYGKKWILIISVM